ncbi:MAG: glutathione S-transferase family protein [Gammaproteobacteria bacterium]|nr:glutathione S-transferase family protein [Gammaproteobacteria bacterium]
MKLITADASPFGRKCRAVVVELALTDKVEVVDSGAVTPASLNAEVNQRNPLGMIPVLELADGDTLMDSPVIAEYLNATASGALFPADNQSRFKSLKLQALADGIMDISVAIRYETALRPESLRWPEWINHQGQAVERGLQTLEQLCPEFAAIPTIGELAVACALGYRDFRFADHDWRTAHPALATWFETMSARDSMRQTIPA